MIASDNQSVHGGQMRQLAGLGFAIPYLHNGQMHDYMPDFIVRLRTDPYIHVIVETKGYDPLAEIKAAPADRWVKAVNAEGSFGQWRYAMARRTTEVPTIIDQLVNAETSRAAPATH
jgi:type III restriction enzyme